MKGNPMPYTDPDSLIVRQRFGIPHPLARFSDGDFQESAYADFILAFIHDWALLDPGTSRHKLAAWFLLESGKTFTFVCVEAGIDADKLRRHLEQCAARIQN